jgi:hypothetical protein
LLAAVIFAVIMAAIYLSYWHNQALFSKGERLTDIQQNARAAIDFLGREIRMAGYTDSPPANSNPTKDPNPIVIARADLLVIRGNISVAAPGGSVDVLYGVQRGNPRGTPTANCPAPPCLMRAVLTRGVSSYNLQPGTEGANAAWQVIAYNIDGLNFLYFDQNNNQLNPAPALDAVDIGAAVKDPDVSEAAYVQRRDVRRVVVNLTARDNRGGMAGQGNEPRYVLWTNINIRNLEGDERR